MFNPENTPIYNFEHEDITYTAFINEEMINTLLPILYKLVPKLSHVVKFVQVASTCYCLWQVYHLFKIPQILAFLWSQLTPGCQWMEIAFIVTGLLMLCFYFVAATEISKNIDAYLKKVEMERQEMKDHIEDLEKENEEMKTTFKTMVSYANQEVMLRKRPKRLRN